MLQNPFDKTFRAAATIMASVILLSAATHFTPIAHMAVFWVLIVATLLFSLWRLQFGVLIAFGELLVGSLGHLFTVNIHGFALSLRLGIFLAVFLAWCIRALRTRKTLLTHPLVLWYAAFVFVLAVGIVNGLLHHNTLGNIFYDVNGFLYLGLVPVFFDGIRTRHDIARMLHVFWAGIIVVTFESLALLSLFAHRYGASRELYRWVRDTRLFEVTNLGDNFYRVFSPAQLFAMCGFFLALSVLVFCRELQKRERSGYFVLLFLSGLTVVLGLSRSFWLGMLVTGIVFLVVTARRKLLTWNAVLRAAVITVVMLAAQLALLLSTVNFPYFLHRPGALPTLAFLEERTTSPEDVAIASRYDLLVPMFKTIARHPLLGTGFGTTVTFHTHDPRSQLVNQGIRTTFAFEWGYLDFWIKIGLSGLIIFLLLLWKISQLLLSTARRTLDRQCLAVLLGLSFGVLAIVVTHTTSPYLNNPLGLGFLAYGSAVAAALAHRSS